MALEKKGMHDAIVKVARGNTEFMITISFIIDLSFKQE